MGLLPLPIISAFLADWEIANGFFPFVFNPPIHFKLVLNLCFVIVCNFILLA
jgi:hypothetical protein